MRVVPVRQIATLDRILHDEAGRVEFHYVLIDWLCHLVPDQIQPTAGSDAVAVRWVRVADLARMPGLDQIAIDLIEKTLLEEGWA